MQCSSCKYSRPTRVSSHLRTSSDVPTPFADDIYSPFLFTRCDWMSPAWLLRIWSINISTTWPARLLRHLQQWFGNGNESCLFPMWPQEIYAALDNAQKWLARNNKISIELLNTCSILYLCSLALLWRLKKIDSNGRSSPLTGHRLNVLENTPGKVGHPLMVAPCVG